MHLRDDFSDAHNWTEIVAGHRDGNAAPIRPARHLAEHRGIERTPPAAVDENRKRRIFAGRRKEQVDRLARRIAV
jgi:hypothetical protein